MLQWITHVFGLSRRFRPSTHFQDIPGSHEPSIHDLRAEAIEFDKNVKGYIARMTGTVPEETPGKLVRNTLKNYPMHPEYPEFWDRFVKEAIVLKGYRNSIIHADVGGLPPLPELHRRFKEANNILRPFTVCSASRDRFTQFRWKWNRLNLKIDQQAFKLSKQDVENLLVELHPSSRGRVYFKAGKKVYTAMLDTANTSRRYFIEGSEPFNLSDQEAMALGDLLLCFLGNRALRMP
ncbi:hypothetical protein [Pseudomonas asiatica]|uniref:hypothetical protein n=1 Tax=Pseudomonas asiatica TaxID=2219225 RepID=UPI0025A3EA62|nr:hypothetical protein [Pseudomonas asiatica]WJN52520.1 hypothetical protein QUR91_12170 [Pseudomonas asiatica]